MKRTLRPDQAEAIEDVRYKLFELNQKQKLAPDDYRVAPRVVLQAPTGYGKTVLAGAIIERALAKNGRVLFIVPTTQLVEQALASFEHEGITEVGVIQADHPFTNWSMPVQIASVQTLMRRKIPDANLVLIDETHIWYKYYSKLFFGFPEKDKLTGELITTAPRWLKVPIVGLSATPWSKGLGCFYNGLSIAGTTRQMIEDGNLCPFEVWCPDHPDLKHVRTLAGDYHEGDLSAAMQADRKLTANIVKTWKELGENRPTFVFAVDRAHARKLQDEFEAAGIRTGYVDGNTNRIEREVLRQQFHRGEIKVVCNVGVLTTGIDWDVRCLVLARPTKSQILFVQIVGRGLRNAPGKDYCLILDHSDNHARLGIVTQIHHERLDDGKIKEKDRLTRDDIPLPKACPKCNFLKPPKCAKCPKCGFVAQHQSTTEVQDGTLKKFEEKKKPDTVASKFTKEQAYAELLGYVRERSKHPGFAAHKFREMFGVWPNHYKWVTPKPPSILMRSWIKSRQIAYAHSKKNPAVNYAVR
jgi:superfamily II DNA or RNA helicase